MKVPVCLKKISPRWYELLKRCSRAYEAYGKYKIDSKILNIDDDKCCIVGEAYKFNDKYSETYNDLQCDRCFQLSMRFAAAINTLQEPWHYGLKTRPSLNKTIESFCKHFRKEHGELIQ